MLPELEAVDNQSVTTKDAATKSSKDSDLYNRIGKVELIANCAEDKEDAFICISAETKYLWKVGNIFRSSEEDKVPVSLYYHIYG